MTEQAYKALYELVVEVDRLLLFGEISDAVKPRMECVMKLAKRELGIPETGFIVQERSKHDERN